MNVGTEEQKGNDGVKEAAAILRAATAGPARILVPLITRTELLHFVLETLAQAKEELQREGLAVARRGSGVYVSDLRPMVRDELSWLATMPWLRGEAPWPEAATGEVQVEHLGVRLEPAGEAVAEALELAVGAEVSTRSWRTLADGRAVVLSTSWLSHELVQGTRATRPDPGPGGIYGVLAELGEAPTGFREAVGARPASRQEAERMALSPGSPVLVVRRVARTAARPVELSESVLDAAVHVLRYDLPAVTDRVGPPVGPTGGRLPAVNPRRRGPR